MQSSTCQYKNHDSNCDFFGHEETEPSWSVAITAATAAVGSGMKRLQPATRWPPFTDRLVQAAGCQHSCSVLKKYYHLFEIYNFIGMSHR